MVGFNFIMEKAQCGGSVSAFKYLMRSGTQTAK